MSVTDSVCVRVSPHSVCVRVCEVKKGPYWASRSLKKIGFPSTKNRPIWLTQWDSLLTYFGWSGPHKLPPEGDTCWRKMATYDCTGHCVGLPLVPGSGLLRSPRSETSPLEGSLDLARSPRSKSLPPFHLPPPQHHLSPRCLLVEFYFRFNSSRGVFRPILPRKS